MYKKRTREGKKKTDHQRMFRFTIVTVPFLPPRTFSPYATTRSPTLEQRLGGIAPRFPPAAAAAEFAAATALNKLPVLGRSGSTRRRNGLGRFSSSERPYLAGPTRIKGLFDDAVASSPFTLVELDVRTRGSPVGSEAGAWISLVLRTEGLCTEPRMDGLRSRAGGAEGADPEVDSPVEPEE